MIWLSFVYKSSATHKCTRRLWGGSFCEDPTISKTGARQYYRGGSSCSLLQYMCKFRLLNSLRMNNGGYLPLIFIGATNASPNQRSRGHDLAPRLHLPGRKLKVRCQKRGSARRGFFGRVAPFFCCNFSYIETHTLQFEVQNGLK